MKKWLHNEKGLTLVELLAVFTVGTIVLLLMIGIITTIQKQYIEQSMQSENLFDVTYVAKMITKDARKTTDVSVNGNNLVLGDTTYTFIPSEQSIRRNGDPFVKNIKEFHSGLTVDSNGNKQLDLKIISHSDKKLETTITLRGGD